MGPMAQGGSRAAAQTGSQAAVSWARLAIMLDRSELERYARHIVLREVGGPGQAKLKAARVLVIGAGGLGAPVLLYLAAAGIGTIGIVDDDAIVDAQLVDGLGKDLRRDAPCDALGDAVEALRDAPRLAVTVVREGDDYGDGDYEGGKKKKGDKKEGKDAPATAAAASLRKDDSAGPETQPPPPPKGGA